MSLAQQTFDYNQWVDDFRWDQYKAAKRQEEYDMWADIISETAGALAGGLKQYSAEGWVDIQPFGESAADILRRIGQSEGFSPFVPTQIQQFAQTAAGQAALGVRQPAAGPGLGTFLVGGILIFLAFQVF